MRLVRKIAYSMTLFEIWMFQKGNISIAYAISCFPKSFSKKVLLAAKGEDAVYDEWLNELKTPLRRKKAMRKYLLHSVKYTKSCIDWINE